MPWNRVLPIIVTAPVLSFILGRAAIPLLRKLKTGRFEAYIGDRFKTDGSEPAFGGAVTLIVFIFTLFISAAVCGESFRNLAAAVFCAAVTLVGVCDDYINDILHKPYGVKPVIKLGVCCCACLVFVLILKQAGFVSTAVLLPFRLGFIDFGGLYCPFAALAMTAVIYCFCIHNRLGTDEKSCCGGLCAATAFFSGLAFAVSGNILSDGAFSAYGYSLSASALGSLIWGLSPSKLRYGSSGGYFFGAAAAVSLVFSPYIMLSAVFAVLGAAADAFCAAFSLIVYKISKRFILKGFTLHSHLSLKGVSDHKIIIVFMTISAVGLIAAAAFSAYAVKII